MKTLIRPAVVSLLTTLVLSFFIVPAATSSDRDENPVAKQLMLKAEIAKRGIAKTNSEGGDVKPLIMMLHQAKASIEAGDIKTANQLLTQIIAQSFPDGMPDVPGIETPALDPVDDTPSTDVFDTPVKVAIKGYSDHIMEPFLTRDGEYMLFNNSNNPKVDTNLHVAQRIDNHTFEYLGTLDMVNSNALDAVASVDRYGNLFFVSSRSYEDTFRMIHTAEFNKGEAGEPDLVMGKITRGKKPYLSMDAEISSDGKTLYYNDNRFGDEGYPETSNVLIARRKGEKFNKIKNAEDIMKNINTDMLEYAPASSEDELEFFFTRADLKQLMTMQGGADLGIYMATRESTDEPFGEPKRISSITGFVEAATVDADGSIYFHRNDNGQFTLYRAQRLADSTQQMRHASSE